MRANEKDINDWYVFVRLGILVLLMTHGCFGGSGDTTFI